MGKTGARRARNSKRRTHVKENEDAQTNVPKSMVIKMGDNKRQLTKSLSQLVRDFRQIMQPHTAAKLQERKNNRLRDFVTMCGPLDISHLFVFSNSSNDNTTLRIARTPRGPTLNFNVKEYSLNKDVRRHMKNPKSDNSGEFLNPPVLIMHGFSKDENKSDLETLMSSMFLNMFPAIDPSTTNLASFKRVLLFKKNGEEIDIRHYAIETKLVDGSKQVRKLNTAKRKLNKDLPNLSKVSDISDYLLDPYSGGYTSESEVEDDAVVEMEEEQKKKKEPTTTKRAVKLVEIGPRMRLQLRKVEEGVCDGKTIYHTTVQKSKKEQEELEKRHKKRRDLKEKRRKEQQANVARKKEEQEGKTSRTKRGILKAKEREEGEEEGEEGTEDEEMGYEGEDNESGGEDSNNDNHDEEMGESVSGSGNDSDSE